MVETIFQLGPLHTYPALFVALIFLGGFVLLPAMFLTLTGVLNIFHLFILTILAAVLSDSFWYVIGLRSKTKEKIYSFAFIKRHIQEANRFSSFYTKHGLRLVFLSKFIYGTRIASQILAGAHKLNFLGFTAAVSLGTAIWFWVFYGLIKLLDFGIESVEATAFRVQIIVLGSFIFLVCFHVLVKRFFRKRLFKNSKE